MAIESLYYPYIKIDNPAWLRSQLLYFDRINTISPWHVGDVILGRDEEELAEKGYLSRKSPTFMKGAVDRASRFMAILLVASRNDRLGSHFSRIPLYSKSSRKVFTMLHSLKNTDNGTSIRRLIPDITNLTEELEDYLPNNRARIHPEKLSSALREFLEGGQKNVSKSELSRNWIDVDPVFSSIYMTVLAREMSASMGASAITDEGVHDALYQDLMATGKLSPLQNARRAEGIVVDVVIKSIKIDPETPIARILKFKEHHTDELHRFQSLISGIAGRCAIMETPENIRSEADLIVRREIDQSIKDLEKSLSSTGIVWSRGGFFKATSFVVGMIGGLITFDFTGNYYWALSASVGLGVSAFGLTLRGDREEVREAAPHSYLLNLRREFGVAEGH